VDNMARLDHIAYRVKDRKKTAQFFIDALNYRIQTEFTVHFDDGLTAECLALEPSEKHPLITNHYWSKRINDGLAITDLRNLESQKAFDELHLPPEIFISDGVPGSIVGNWVEHRDGVGGIHHLAYMVDSVEEKMKEWQEKGYAEFSSDKPLTCPGLKQVFTKPSELTGVIYEFIEREEHGFCVENVGSLMESTRDNL